MKRVILLLASVIPALFSLSAQSADVLKTLEAVRTNMVTASYSCTVGIDGTEIQFKGTVKAQGNCFHLEGNGMEIWCDGNNLLITDPASKEAYLEPASSLAEYIEAHKDSVRGLKLEKVSISGYCEDISEFILPLSILTDGWILTDLTK